MTSEIDFESLLLPSRQQVKRGTWNDYENHKIYADWLGKKLGYRTMEDWYQLTKKKIYDNYGGGLIASKYNNSPLQFIQGLFPEYNWLPWKFGTVMKGYWKDINNQKLYADWLGTKLGYTTMEDWYQLTTTKMHIVFDC